MPQEGRTEVPPLHIQTESAETRPAGVNPIGADSFAAIAVVRAQAEAYATRGPLRTFREKPRDNLAR